MIDRKHEQGRRLRKVSAAHLTAMIWKIGAVEKKFTHFDSSVAARLWPLIPLLF